jgi:hypothetical protein
MIRLMGILTGSAIAVGFLILTIGMPEFDATRGETTRPADPVLQSEASRQVEAAAKPEKEPHIHSIAAALPDEPPVTAPDIALDSAPDLLPEPMARVEEAPQPRERQWYAFWSPFRSEMAADGFVSQLQRTTGLDYRVVKLKPGVYEVAFAYSDDNDIEDKLAQISTATGLDLTGG